MSSDHDRGDPPSVPSRPTEPRRSGRTRAGVAVIAVIAVVGGFVLFSRLGHGWTPLGQTDDNASRTDHEFAVATALAHQEVDRFDLPVVSATATVDSGTLLESNTGHPCTSGTLLHIKLIGDFHKIAHGDIPGQPYEPTSAVLITADPESEQACLISVSAGKQTPEAGSVVLFTE